MADLYSFDKCSICGKYTALKNGVCIDCENKLDIPDFLEDLLK
jgi:hypothetical protein